MAERILLTGATGVVGSALLARLRAAGHEVETLSRFEGKMPEAHIVIHAGWAGSDGAQRNDPALLAMNEEIGMKLLELAAKSGCKRWIGFGSQAEYSPSLATNIAEDAAAEPATAYGQTKLKLCRMQQEFCKKNNVAFLWLRLFTCYSRASKPSYLIPYLIETLKRGEMPALHTPHAMEDFLHADDAAEGVLAALGGEGIYNLASGKGVPVGEVALTLARQLGFADITALEKHISENTAPATARVADIAKFSNAFGWQPRISLAEGLAQCLPEQAA